MNPLLSPSAVDELIRTGGALALDATLAPPGSAPSVSARERYLECHLPGAVFFDIEELSDHASSLPHMLPAPAAFAEQMSALGIGNAAHLVVYEQQDVFAAPRAWWMLRTMGATSVFLMDGGLQAWRAADLPVASGPVRRPRADFQARPALQAVATLADVEATIRSGGQLLDARSDGRFSGRSPEPRAGLRSGHMPGSSSLPYTELIDGARLKGVETLRAALASKGVNLEQPVITSCGSGVTAAVLLLGSR